MNARSVPNFSISSRNLVSELLSLALIALLLAAAPAAAKKNKKRDRQGEMFNLLLGIDYSHWLVGPVAYIATPEEIDAYLALVGDEEAQAFIDAFWNRRAEGLGPFEKKPRQIFEGRAEEADKRFFEAAMPGRGSARGAVYTVWGEPEEIRFETPEEVDSYTLEVWTYGDDTPLGLDGEKPQKTWKFVKIDGETVLYSGQKKRDPMSRMRRRSGFDG